MIVDDRYYPRDALLSKVIIQPKGELTKPLFHPYGGELVLPEAAVQIEHNWLTTKEYTTVIHLFASSDTMNYLVLTGFLGGLSLLQLDQVEVMKEDPLASCDEFSMSMLIYPPGGELSHIIPFHLPKWTPICLQEVLFTSTYGKHGYMRIKV